MISESGRSMETWRVKRSTVALLCLGVSTLVVGLRGTPASAQDDVSDAQAAKDKVVVETLLRLPKERVEALRPTENPKLRDAIGRYLKTVEGTSRYVEVVGELGLKDAVPGLLDLAIEQAEENLGTEALRAAMRLDGFPLAMERFSESDEPQRLELIKALGGVGNRRATDQLLEWIKDEDQTRTVRQTSVAGLLRSQTGRKRLGDFIVAGELPDVLKITTAAAIEGASDAGLKQQVAGALELPVTGSAEPLPPLGELLRMTGTAVVGKEVFTSKGTCANCHSVRGEGKEVGPDLSEIGSKLSREAMFVSILDPSAGVSHNYETYAIQTLDGELVSGILLSETEEAVTLKTSEALVREIAQEDIDLMQKQTQSLMPAGLQKNMSVDELVSLVDYLMSLKKVEGDPTP